MRRLLISSEKNVGLFEEGFEVCFYDEELEAIVDRERDIIEALNAIASDSRTNDDLILLFQPIIDLKEDSVCGVQVLSRLNT